MLCPTCKTAAVIAHSYTAVRGDESPETQTEVYTVQEFVCRNPACPLHTREVAKTEHRIY